MADDSLLVLSIVEQGVSDAITVILEQDDLPHGAQRGPTAWQEGGEVKLGNDSGTYLPGRDEPIYHVLQNRFAPRVLKGALRDHLWGVDGHARNKRDELERVRLRNNLVKVTWDVEGFTGFLREAKFDVEGPGDILYEITFLVSSVDGFAQSQEQPQVHADAGPDLVAQLQADAATRRAELVALSIRANIQIALLSKYDAVDDALGSALDATTLVESGDVGQGQQAQHAIQGAIAASQVCAGKAADLAATVDGLAPSDVLDVPTAATGAAWTSVQASIISDMLAMRDAMRSVAAQARAKLYSSTRLYLVQDGDTLDQVALAALGSRGRANDLGITQAELAASAGRYIRLPLS